MVYLRVAPHYQFDLIPQQAAFHKSKARHRVLVAGARSGKTYAAVVELILEAYNRLAAGNINPLYSAQATSKHKIPALHLWIVSPTWKMTDVPLKYFLDVCADLIIRANDHEKVYWLKGDILVEFKTAERPETLQGASIDGMLIDEAASLRDEKPWTESLSARLVDRKGYSIFSTTPQGFNWFFTHIYTPALNKEHGFDLFTWKTIDNPLIDPEEIEMRRAIMPPQNFRTLFEASFEAFEGQVYACFNPQLHVMTYDEFARQHSIKNETQLRLKFQHVWVGFDYGHTNPSAMIVVGKLWGDENEYVVLEEIYQSGVHPISTNPHTPSWLKHAQSIQERYKTTLKMFYADSANPGPADQLRQNGIPIMKVNKHGSKGSVVDSIELVQMLFSAGKLIILSRCTNLLKEIQQYKWKEKRQINDPDEPSKSTPDHALDAMRYVLMSVVDKRVIKPNYNALTYPIRS